MCLRIRCQDEKLVLLAPSSKFVEAVTCKSHILKPTPHINDTNLFLTTLFTDNSVLCIFKKKSLKQI